MNDGNVAIPTAFTVNGLINMTGGKITDAGMLVLGGNVQAISDSVTNSATISAGINLNGVNPTFTVNSGPNAIDLDVTGQITGNGGWTKAGAGYMQLDGTPTNNYTGTTFVNDGLLKLNNSGADLAIPGNLVIGDGTGSASSARVAWLQASEINAGSNVTVNSDGLLDLGSFAQAIASLTINSGNVSNSGSLFISGALTFNGTAAGGDMVTVNATGTNIGQAKFNSNPLFSFSGITSFVYHGESGSNQVLINNPAGGLFAPSGGIFDNDSGTGTFVDAGGGTATDVGLYTPTTGTPGGGTLSHTEGASIQTLTFGGLATVDDSVTSGTYTVNTTNSTEQIGITNPAAGQMLVSSGASNTFAGVDYFNKINVTVKAGTGSDTITVNSPAASTGLSTFLVTATAGTNVWNVQAIPVGVTTTLVSSGSGTDTVNVSSNAPTNTGTLAGLAGQTLNLAITSNGPNSLHISESGLATPDNVTVNTGASPYSFSSATLGWTIKDVNGFFTGGDTLSLGSGGNTVTVMSVFGGEPVTVNSGTGARHGQRPVRPYQWRADHQRPERGRQRQSRQREQRPGHPRRGEHHQRQQHDEHHGRTIPRMPRARTVTLTNAAITGLAPAAINYLNAEMSAVTIDGGSGGNTFNVASTISGSSGTTTINGGSGDDTFNITGKRPDGNNSVNHFNGQNGNDFFNVTSSPVAASGVTWSIDGGAPTVPVGDQLIFNAQNLPVTLTPTSIQSGTNKTLNFVSIETYTVNNASGAQAPSFTSTPSASFAEGALKSFSVTASGTPNPILSEDPTDVLPNGVQFNAATGLT